MLAIQVGNHFGDEFAPPCQVGYFINSEERKLTDIYLSHFLHFQILNFLFPSFKDVFMSELHIKEQK